MRARVDQEGCISCGLCVGTCPEVFQFDDSGKAAAVLDPIPKDEEDATRQAAEGCPVSVIGIES